MIIAKTCLQVAYKTTFSVCEIYSFLFWGIFGTKIVLQAVIKGPNTFWPHLFSDKGSHWEPEAIGTNSTCSQGDALHVMAMCQTVAKIWPHFQFSEGLPSSKVKAKAGILFKLCVNDPKFMMIGQQL